MVTFRTIYRGIHALVMGGIEGGPQAGTEAEDGLNCYAPIGSCSRALPPGKSVLSVNKATATEPSIIHFSRALELPTDRRNDPGF
jgi:hypothetical protein